MSYGFLDVITTSAIERVQAQWGSREYFSTFTGDRKFDRFDDKVTDFIENSDTFFIATVTEGGWPYVQHRGGPRGFLKVLDERTLAFADFKGNQQYLTAGNSNEGSRACLIIVDFAHRRRVKILVAIEMVERGQDDALFDRLVDPDYAAVVERAFRLKLEAYDFNCPQHIRQRFDHTEVRALIEPFEAKIAALEAENERLRRSARGAAPIYRAKGIEKR
jgi:predicted pyridoxine 5'-phosphate oxidase superfamily flavin-nucleotide-binding protein